MKKRILAIMCIAVLVLSGCGNGFPQLTDEEVVAIGEYAAIELLKYDANSRSRLVDLSKVEEEPVGENRPEEQVKPEVLVPEPSQDSQLQKPEIQTPDVNDNPSAMAASFEEFLEMPEGVSVTCTGYELCPSYQEEGSLYFALEASEGKTLLVVGVTLQNDSSAAQEIDLIHRNDNYRLTVNGTYTRTALITMLTNDMTTYKGSLAPGASENLVLVIEVDSEISQNIQSISLNLKNESKTYTIQVL